MENCKAVQTALRLKSKERGITSAGFHFVRKKTTYANIGAENVLPETLNAQKEVTQLEKSKKDEATLMRTYIVACSENTTDSVTRCTKDCENECNEVVNELVRLSWHCESLRGR